MEHEAVYCKCAFVDDDRKIVPGEPCTVHPKVDPQCETCRGLGIVDETLGGWGASMRSDAPCPDCVNPSPIYVPPKPRVCLCHWLGFIGFKCRAHSASTNEENT